MTLIPFTYPPEFYRLCEASEMLVKKYCGPRAWRAHDLSGDYFVTFGGIADDHTTLINPPTVQKVREWVNARIADILREESNEAAALARMEYVTKSVIEKWGVPFDPADFVNWMFRTNPDGTDEDVAERYVAEKGGTGTGH